jgi:SNF family Na+-dependent transporter
LVGELRWGKVGCAMCLKTPKMCKNHPQKCVKLCENLQKQCSYISNFSRFLRVGAVTNSLFIGIYYTAIVAYFALFATKILPLCLQNSNISYYFFDSILPQNGGYFSLSIALFLAICWAVIWLILSNKIKINTTATLSVGVQISLFLLLILRGLAYNNSFQALQALFVPNISAFCSIDIWLEALFQALLSLSLAAFVMPTFALSMPQNASLKTCTAVIILANFVGCILSSMAMFLSLYGCGLKDSISRGGLFLAFSVYPAAIVKLYKNKLICGIFGVIFYISLTFTALQSAVSLLNPAVKLISSLAKLHKNSANKATNTASKTTNTSSKTKIKLTETKTCGIFCLIGFILSLVFATNVAYPAITILDGYACGISAPFIAVCECALFAYFARKNCLDKRKITCFVYSAILILLSILFLSTFNRWLFTFNMRLFPQFEFKLEIFFGFLQAAIILTIILIMPTIYLFLGKKGKLWKKLNL